MGREADAPRQSEQSPPCRNGQALDRKRQGGSSSHGDGIDMLSAGE